jgi:hypothetical protein
MSTSDTGPHFYLNGEHYYRQIDDLSLNICVARTIVDADWADFLEGSRQLSRKLRREPKVIVACFAYSFPNTAQRRMTTAFLDRNNVPTVSRIGVLADNPILRSVIVAFSWVVPSATLRSFRPSHIYECLRWLREVADFDLQHATNAWTEGRAAFGNR